MRILSVFLALILFSVNVQGQTMLEKLDKLNKGNQDPLLVKRSESLYFIEGPGIVYLTNGKTVEGMINIPVDVSAQDLSTIYVIPNGKMKRETYYTKAIDYCEIEGRKFYSKINGSALMGKRYMGEMLNANTTDKLQLFKAMSLSVIKDQNSAFNNTYSMQEDYFVLMPDFKKGKTKDLSGLGFMPFATNMADLIKDCPELAEKVKNKEEGYKINLLSFKIDPEVVFIKIVTEYNECQP